MLRARHTAALPRVEGARPRNRWPELHAFFTGHDLRGDGFVTAADMSLRELRAQGWEERTVARALEDLGVDYVPYADGRTCLEWIAWLHHEVVIARE